MTSPKKREPVRADSSGLSICFASLVLALATGVPVHSVRNFLPHPDDQPAPYLGV